MKKAIVNKLLFDQKHYKRYYIKANVLHSCTYKKGTRLMCW